MTALLQKTYGVAVVYGYGEHLHTLTLRNEAGKGLSALDYFLDTLREEVIEDYQSAGLLTWDAINVVAQDRLLRNVEDTLADPFAMDAPFAREAAEYMALDGLITFTCLTPLFQSKVDAEVQRVWENR